MTRRTYLRLLFLTAMLSMLVLAPGLQRRSSVHATSYSKMSEDKMSGGKRIGQKSECPPGTRTCPGGDCVPVYLGCVVPTQQ
jgi:hypothetical protein